MDNVNNDAADIRLLRFRLGKTLFAIDIMRINEVVTSRDISPPRGGIPLREGDHLPSQHPYPGH
jgi:chemotaxis signal transduction protein